LESSLTLEDSRLGAIDHQLDMRICRVVDARARTRVYRDESLMVPLVHISGKPLEFICQTADVLLYLMLGATGKFELRPTSWRRARTTILGPAVMLRYCATAREVSRYDTYVFFTVSLVLTLLFPFCFRAGRLYFPPFVVVFLPLRC